MDIVHERESYAIMGACFEVYREIGCGFTEPVYQECLELKLGLQSIPFQAKRPINLQYKGRQLVSSFEPDFICYDLVVREIKAVSEPADAFRAQVHNYLKATGIKLGLLVNFGNFPKLKYERIVR